MAKEKTSTATTFHQFTGLEYTVRKSELGILVIEKRPLLCLFSYFSPPCDSVSSCPLENLFGYYLEKGVILEKRGLVSVADEEGPSPTSNRYVMADITSFFTLLVGIYFPSVTGQRRHTSVKQAWSWN